MDIRAFYLEAVSTSLFRLNHLFGYLAASRFFARAGGAESTVTIPAVSCVDHLHDDTVTDANMYYNESDLLSGSNSML